MGEVVWCGKWRFEGTEWLRGRPIRTGLAGSGTEGTEGMVAQRAT